MVSLRRYEIALQRRRDVVSGAVVDFFGAQPIASLSQPRLSNAQHATVMALRAIQQRDQNAFEEAVQEITRRRVSSEADWIHDDLLVFSLACGHSCFPLDKTLILSICETRVRTETGDKRELTSAFETLLTEKGDDSHPVVFSARAIIQKPLPSHERFAEIYQRAHRALLNDPDSLLMSLAALRTIDTIVERKGIGDAQELDLLRKFRNRFVGRVETIARAVYLLVLLFSGALWAIIFGRQLKGIGWENLSTAWETWSFLAPFGIFLAQRKIQNWVTALLQWVFGYREHAPTELLED